MTSNPQQRPEPGKANGHDGLAVWLLGALGLLWAGRLAMRGLRKEKVAIAVGEEAHPENYGVNRLSGLVASRFPVSTEPTRGHETRDANAKWILGIIVFLFVFGLAIHFILAGFFAALKRKPPPTDRWRPNEQLVRAAASVRPPFPKLQVSPTADLQSFRTREDVELQTYGWLDSTSGVVRIPIERAMEMVLQEGLPSRTGTNSGQLGPSTYQLMRQRPEHREPEIQGQK